MRKVKVVQFHSQKGARVFINPENLDELMKRDDCLVDPDLREVQKIPTCFWKRKGHAAVPMDEAEMREVKDNFEPLSAPYSISDIKRPSGDMETLVKDTIANFLDIYTSGLTNQVLKAQEREYNRICYKFNVIIFLFISIIMMGVIHGWLTK